MEEGEGNTTGTSTEEVDVGVVVVVVVVVDVASITRTSELRIDWFSLVRRVVFLVSCERIHTVLHARVL